MTGLDCERAHTSIYLDRFLQYLPNNKAGMGTKRVANLEKNGFIGWQTECKLHTTLLGAPHPSVGKTPWPWIAWTENIYVVASCTARFATWRIFFLFLSFFFFCDPLLWFRGRPSFNGVTMLTQAGRLLFPSTRWQHARHIFEVFAR